MSTIAEKHYGDKNKWEPIAKANPLVDPAHMKIGTKLVIPPLPTEAPKPAGGGGPPTAPTTPAAPAGQTTHVVAAGETLMAIARKHYGNASLWEEIYDANKSVIGDDPEALKVGMKLVIPAKKG